MPESSNDRAEIHAHHEPAVHASRRRFLQSAAAMAAAAGLTATASARPRFVKYWNGDDDRKAAPRTPLGDGETIRIGIIGTGGMGNGHVEAFLGLSQSGKANVQIVAVCDVNDKNAAAAKKKCDAQSGVEVTSHRDHKELLARKDLHAVLIASPEHWHADHAIDALLAGKDVYLEKPMTLDLDGALRLRAVLKNNPEMVMQVGTQYAALPKYLEAKKVIESGQLGKPLWTQCSYCRNTPSGEWNYYGLDKDLAPGKNLDWDRWCGPAGKEDFDIKLYARWRRYRKYSTGIVGDLLVHEMTPMFVSLNSVGWPTRVVACGGHLVDKSMENHDQVNLTVEFEGGHVMIVAGSTNNELGLEKLIRCQKGNIYLNSRDCVIRPERPFAEEVEEQTIRCENVGNDQDRHRLNWLECIRTRQQPSSDIEQGTKVMVVVDLATRSLWEGGAYAFDPKKMVATKL